MREELDAMLSRQASASDGADDALEPSAQAAAAGSVAEPGGAHDVSGAAAAVAGQGTGSGTAAAGLQNAAHVAAAGGDAAAAAAAPLNVNHKKEKQKLDKDKRVQDRLQVMWDV